LDYENPNLIFNDLILEAIFTKNPELYNLVKKFLLPVNNYEKLIINLIKLYTHEEQGIFRNLNKYLRKKFSQNFLLSTILFINSAIRKNFCGFRFENKCYRKANLSQEEYEKYLKIFEEKKNFFWSSFISASKSKLKNKDFIYNTIFSIEFISDSWGMDISKFSLSNENDEILLPAFSLFEITNISKNENEKIILINLLKIDINANYNYNYITNANYATKDNFLNKNNRVLNIDNSPLLYRLDNNNNNNNFNLIKLIDQEIELLKSNYDDENCEFNYKEKFWFLQDEINFLKIKIGVNGPKGSFYENGIFQINFFISEGYPNKKPSIKFLTKIFHPNISFDSGDIDNEIIEKMWKPSLSIKKFLMVLLDLLYEPYDKFWNLDTKAKKEFRKDKRKYGFLALEKNRKYADFSGLIDEYKKIYNCGNHEAKMILLKEDKFK
jgi:ubiquitin-protein ligase